jgi:hypothetical protein
MLLITTRETFLRSRLAMSSLGQKRASSFRGVTASASWRSRCSRARSATREVCASHCSAPTSQARNRIQGTKVLAVSSDPRLWANNQPIS